MSARVKDNKITARLCAELAKKVDVVRAIFKVNCKEIPLTYASLTKVLGLPCSGPSIPIRKDIAQEEFLTACRRFNLPLSGRVSQYDLWAHLDGVDGTHPFADEFKAKLLLFIIGTLLKPTTNVHLHFREYIPILNGMDNLCDFNWAKFVIDGLLDAVNVFQMWQAKSLGGCLLYI